MTSKEERKTKKQTESNRKRNYKHVEVFLENFGSFIMMMSSLTFDPVSVPRKREREQRLRICNMTTVKGKRKNTRTNNLKQEEKIILRFLLFNRRFLALNAVTAVNFANSQHGAAFCSSVDSLHCCRFLRNNDHTSATKYCKGKGSMRGKKWMNEKNYALTSLTV